MFWYVLFGGCLLFSVSTQFLMVFPLIFHLFDSNQIVQIRPIVNGLRFCRHVYARKKLMK